MIKKLLSLFAIATLASFATHANEEVTNAPVILEEVNLAEKADLFAADEVLLEEPVTEEEVTRLADCGCGCKKKNGKGEGCKGELLAGCGCHKTKKPPSEPAPKQLLADNTVEKAADEILPTEEAEEKFASCCSGSCSAETSETTPVVEEVIEEAKFA